MKIMCVILSALFFPAMAQAYLGTGVGLSSLGNLIGVIGVIMVGGIGVFFWPVMMAYDWCKKKIKPTKESDDAGDQNESL